MVRFQSPCSIVPGVNKPRLYNWLSDSRNKPYSQKVSGLSLSKVHCEKENDMSISYLRQLHNIRKCWVFSITAQLKFKTKDPGFFFLLNKCDWLPHFAKLVLSIFSNLQIFLEILDVFTIKSPSFTHRKLSPKVSKSNYPSPIFHKIGLIIFFYSTCKQFLVFE